MLTRARIATATAALAMTVALTSCDPATRGVDSLAFCQSAAGAIQRATALKQAGAFTPTELSLIDSAVTAIDPYCTAPAPGEPTAAVLNALNTMLVIIATKEPKA